MFNKGLEICVIPALLLSTSTTTIYYIMTQEFDYQGHRYKVVKVENSTDHLIIRDGRQTRRVKEEIADKAIEFVDKLFD